MASKMNPGISTAPQAVKMALPKGFSGKREELNQFIMSCLTHLIINQKVYDANEKKIGFMMALPNEGEAGAWKKQFIQAAYNTASGTRTLMTFGMFDDFLCDLRAAFQPTMTLQMLWLNSEPVKFWTKHRKTSDGTTGKIVSVTNMTSASACVLCHLTLLLSLFQKYRMEISNSIEEEIQGTMIREEWEKLS